MTDWAAVASHPAVKAGAALGSDVDWWSPLLAHPAVKSFAGEHGGYFLCQLDPLGRVWELHAAITPEEWGRPASERLKGVLTGFDAWDVILATEVEGNWRSRPPKSFGFRPAGPLESGFRTWILTRVAWEDSPARRRMG